MNHNKNVEQRLDRHSGTGYRGDPKKGGGGGKGTWGRPGDEMRAVAIVDENDPNYDSETEEGAVIAGRDVSHSQRGNRERASSYAAKVQESSETMSADQFKTACQSIIDDYLASGDITAATKSLKDLNEPHLHGIFVRRVVLHALDKKDKQQEMTSALLALLYSSRVLTAEQIGQGFDTILDSIEDVELDVPDACELILKFVACAIKDGCLPPSFLSHISDPVLRRGKGSLVFHDILRTEENGEALAAFKKSVQNILTEYFESQEVSAVKSDLTELNHSEWHHEFVKRAVQMALERKDRERELVSELLAAIGGSLVSHEKVEQGFDKLLDSVDDLALDTPDVTRLLAQFIARAVVDEVLPPSYISRHIRTRVEGSKIGDVIDQSHVLLNMNHATIRLSKIWGPGDGRPVDEVKQAIVELVQEYFSASDVEEATRCIKELDSPYFHHEVVKRVLVIAMEKTEAQVKLALDLLQALNTRAITSLSQLVQGFDRVKESIDDLKLDVPGVAQIWQTIVSDAKERKLLPASYSA